MKILLIGCGKMGTAILNGWLKGGIKKTDLTIVDPAAKPIAGIKLVKTLNNLSTSYSPDIVFLAVKPQNIEEVVSELGRFSKAIFISILAGTRIATIKANSKSKVVRAMPNLPALIGQGITAIFTKDNVSKTIIDKLFKPIGQVVWVKKEDDLDAVTAISGSGPAYVFYFMQEIIKTGKALGLDEKATKELVFATFKGSVALAESSKKPLSELINNVASRGGTTEAALRILSYNNTLPSIISGAVQKAHRRAKELAK